jgi:hypothetical protein
MIGSIATATRAAAPFVGSAAVAGGKALAGFAVAAKVGGWAQAQGFQALDHLTHAGSVARQARKANTDSVTQTQERMAS